MRFSKKAMVGYLETKATNINCRFREVYGRPLFSSTGYSQVAGMETHAIVMYGEWRATLDIIEAIEGGYVTDDA